MSQPPPDTAAAGRSIAWCWWHGGFSDTARLVRVEETGSNGRGTLFACADCRTRHGFVPIEDQP